MEEISLFTKMLEGSVEVDMVHQDDKCFVINDNNPKADVHLLVIPKKPIKTLFELSADDKDLMGHMMLLLPQLALSHQLDGFKTQINTGKTAGQEIFHLHIHLMGNK
jgi:histidine triad (HIT) family protein